MLAKHQFVETFFIKLFASSAMQFKDKKDWLEKFSRHKLPPICSDNGPGGHRINCQN